MPRNFERDTQALHPIVVASMRPRQMPRNFDSGHAFASGRRGASMRPRQMPRNFQELPSLTCGISSLLQ